MAAVSISRPDSDDLGFFVRTGQDASLHEAGSRDISVGGITLFGGKDELISNGTLQLVYGVKYGLVGRNGVGKSTLLRAIADKTIKLPPFLFIIHVEQECAGEDLSALEAVLAVDKERTWLLKKEEYLMEHELDEHEGVTLSEVGNPAQK